MVRERKGKEKGDGKCSCLGSATEWNVNSPPAVICSTNYRGIVKCTYIRRRPSSRSLPLSRGEVALTRGEVVARGVVSLIEFRRNCNVH